MAIAPGSYSFMGGAVLGKGSEGQFVLVRSGSLLTAFTDDEYNACLEAVHDGKAVCVQYKIGSATFQTQLLNVTGLGNLQFVDTSVQSVTHYRVAGTSPHTVSIVKTGSAQQFVLERDDMSTAFTASEYLQCQARISEGTALCVQWKSGSARMQAQLAAMLADGTLLFSHTTVDLETIFIVAGSDPHNITAHTNSLGGGGDQFVLTRANMTTAFTDTEYQDCVDALTGGKAVCLKVGTTANCMQLQLTQNTNLIGLQFEATYGDYHYLYAVAPTPGAHTISENIHHFGVPIYGSLQSAIADADTLYPGMYFETNGFHTAGDGGAARYKVSSTGTANGMDIVQLAAGKLAILQISDGTGTPEQFGYDRFNQDDLTPVMTRMQAAHIRNIVLSPLESGDSFPYLMKTTFTPNPAVRITSRFNFNTGAAGRIWFVPTTYGINRTVMFQLTGRGFEIKDIVLMNRPWFTEGDKHNCVCFRMAISGNNNMFYEFDSLAIQGFDIGFLHENVDGQDSSGIIWHCTCNELQMALNNVNIYLKNVQYLTKFENCFLTVNDSGARSVVLEETFSTEFTRCNFGIYNPAVTVVDFKDFLVAGKAVDRRFSQAKFTNCNFEIESDDSHPLPTSAKGFFMRFEDHDEFTVELDNCCFIITPLVRNNIYGCRPIQLGSKTRFKITNSSGPYGDVNYSGNEFYGWDYCKRTFDETKPPMKEVGSLIIQHCVGIIPPPNNQWGSIYLPTVKTDDMTCPQSDDNTEFLNNYPDAKDGVLLLNLDKANIETKIGNSIVQVTTPAAGKVRIGDRIYDYVTIDGRKWITTNLRLWTMGTRQWHYSDHDEYGFYYQVQSFSEIDALLPAGWRRPTNTDFNSLVSQGYAALQATGQTAFPSATNSSGFSALPSQRWKKPNTTHTFTNCFLWGTDQGNGYSALRIASTAVSIAGWTYSDINSASDPVYVPMRVCCDA